MIADAITHGFACAIIGVVYSLVLAGEDTPLNPWYRWLDDWHSRGGWRSWVASPIGGCEKCLSGQLALWSSVYLSDWPLSFATVFAHVLAACAAVLSAAAIGSAYRWLRNRI